MDTKIMCTELPTEAPKEILTMALQKYMSDLGGQRTIYKRVSLVDAPELEMIMTPDAWDDYYTRRKNRWAAECTCTVCGETWHTTWRGGPLKGICIIEGEDGLTYPCIDEEDAAPGTVIEVASNDGFLCPCCDCATTLTHANKMRPSRSWRLMISSVDNVGIYTTIFYWLVNRVIDVDGCVYSNISPWNAYVIDEGGKLRHFTYGETGWKFSKGKWDAFYSQYPSNDGSFYNYRYGGYSYGKVPSLVGCTGEKTGIKPYMEAGGVLPVLYMKTWRRHPAIENLAVAGWTQMIEQDFYKESNESDIPYAFLPGVDFSKRRPNEMLRMDKASFRKLSQKYPTGWSLTEYETWLEYQDVEGQATAELFDSYYGKFKLAGVKTVIDLRKTVPQIDFPKIDRYLEKQGLEREQVQLLSDTWAMTMKLFGRPLLTHEEMWPRDLMQAHDRMMQQFRLEQSKGEWAKFLAAFMAVYQKHRALEWTDGELCIVLPRDNGDLIREGDTLRHCVYSYGEKHITGQHMIFFVRRYRRPERCYYTLDYRMTGTAPIRQQLHGYGNERHGPNKEYTHKIPQKVKDFCDRWEREVLLPWFAEQKRAEQRNKGAVHQRKEQKTA